MHQKLKFDNLFQILDYTIYNSRNGFWTDRKSQEGKKLKFAPQLDKFSYWKLAFRNLMF